MRICVLPGDGIGPEVTRAALRVLDVAASRFEFGVDLDERPFGGAAIDATGHPFPDATREACLGADAVLLGAVGGPSWNGAADSPGAGTARAALGARLLRQPAPGAPLHAPHDEPAARGSRRRPRHRDRARADRRHLLRRSRARRRGRLRHLQLQRVRDPPHRGACLRPRRAPQRPCHERRQGQCARHLEALATCRGRGRRGPSGRDAGAPARRLDGDAARRAARRLRRDRDREPVRGRALRPGRGVSGGIGLAPSASLADGGPGIFEPIHGSAPDIAGSGKANPAGAILSVALLLDELGQPTAARAIERAVTGVLDDGARTPDLGGSATTDEVAGEIADALAVSSSSMAH